VLVCCFYFFLKVCFAALSFDESRWQSEGEASTVDRQQEPRGLADRGTGTGTGTGRVGAAVSQLFSALREEGGLARLPACLLACLLLTQEASKLDGNRFLALQQTAATAAAQRTALRQSRSSENPRARALACRTQPASLARYACRERRCLASCYLASYLVRKLARCLRVGAQALGRGSKGRSSDVLSC